MGLTARQRNRRDDADSSDEGELVDTTASLTLHSRRTDRQRKRQLNRKAKVRLEGLGLLDLPLELLHHILVLLRPSDICRLSRVSKSLLGFIKHQGDAVVEAIIAWRYPCLQKCFRRPILLQDVDPELHPLLMSETRQEILAIHKKPYQHVQPPDPSVLCTCLTCVLRWNSLCLVVDFAYWQDSLEKGEPIPMIPRGQAPAWNRDLIVSHSRTVMKALNSSLWYGCVLEAHLKSTTCSISRHSKNKGNQRRRFRMTAEDIASGTDAFLERSGPPTLDVPFHRDNYYVLECFLPSRSWNSAEQRWMYAPAGQHDIDLQFVIRWAKRQAGVGNRNCSTDHVLDHGTMRQ